jgi:hypothetical protein
MTVFGRRVLLTTLDPVPRGLRAAPGLLAMNKAELEAFRAGERETFRTIAAICSAEDHAEAMLTLRQPQPRRHRLNAPTRMFMLRAVYLQRQALAGRKS